MSLNITLKIIPVFLFVFFLVCEMYMQVTKHGGTMSISDGCQLGE